MPKRGRRYNKELLAGIYAYLKKRRTPARTSVIVNLFRISKPTALAYLEKLHRQGKVRKIRFGRYYFWQAIDLEPLDSSDNQPQRINTTSSFEGQEVRT